MIIMIIIAVHKETPKLRKRNITKVQDMIKTLE